MKVLAGRLLFALLGGALCVSAASAQAETRDCYGAPSSTRLIISVDGVRSTKGYVVANLYGPDKRRFLADNGWLVVWREPAQPKSTQMCIFLPAPGDYALVVFHDANSNGDLDVGPFGPREGYGFSNNVRPFFSAPSLESAKFKAAEGDTTLHIRLHYP
ncbi:MAG: DUF2141 domain-containing protein [Caulobacterales bacterium]